MPPWAIVARQCPASSKHAPTAVAAACTLRRSAPLPLKVDGFSMGAVMGYSEQHTLLLLTDDTEVETFLNVSGYPGACPVAPHVLS